LEAVFCSSVLEPFHFLFLVFFLVFLDSLAHVLIPVLN